jgi:hypothetical protein
MSRSLVSDAAKLGYLQFCYTSYSPNAPQALREVDITERQKI